MWSSDVGFKEGYMPDHFLAGCSDFLESQSISGL